MASAPASSEDTTHSRPTALGRLTGLLRRDAVGGVLLLVATLAALIWANSPAAGSYSTLQQITVGPAALHLDLDLATWAADGLLAVFFFVVGLELKHEFTAGSLRDPRRALVPIVAAAGGVVVPAVFYLAVVGIAGTGGLRGWAIPAATDIAFAVAVLAVVGRGLPIAVRTFLLTLAVVDDLIAITIIAVGYTGDLDVGPLLLGLLPLTAYAFLARRGITTGWVLIPLALVTWGLVHASGVHATVAGVLLGLVVPTARTEALAERWRPFSNGLAVPVFAFFAAGVTVGGLAGFAVSLTDPVALGIIAGLVLGKTVGVLGAAWATTRVTSAHLDDRLRWSDLAAMAPLTGIGFTVALLIGELAFDPGSPAAEHVKVGVLTASTLAALLGAALLAVRARVLRRAGGARSDEVRSRS